MRVLGVRLTPKAHKVEVHQGTQAIGFATDEIVVTAGEGGGIGSVDAADELVAIGYSGVHLLPEGIDATLNGAVGIVEGCIIAVGVIGGHGGVILRHGIEHAVSEFLAIGAGTGHLEVDACKGILISLLRGEIVFCLNLSLGADIEPVGTGGERYASE